MSTSAYTCVCSTAEDTGNQPLITRPVVARLANLMMQLLTAECHSQIEDEISSLSYVLHDCFYASFVPSSALSSPNATEPSAFLSATLQPWSPTIMVLDVGPGLCAYRYCPAPNDLLEPHSKVLTCRCNAGGRSSLGCSSA